MKFLELIVLVPKLTKYSAKSLAKNQYGFVKNLSIGEAKRKVRQLIKDIQNRNETPYILYVDLKSAYDAVNQQKLYEIVKR